MCLKRISQQIFLINLSGQYFCLTTKIMGCHFTKIREVIRTVLQFFGCCNKRLKPLEIIITYINRTILDKTRPELPVETGMIRKRSIYRLQEIIPGFHQLSRSLAVTIDAILLQPVTYIKEIDCAYSGDIAAAVGFKDVTTGDTLCDVDHPIILEKMEFPDPVISVAVEPKTKADQEKMGNALQRLAEEDPTFKVHTDPESNQTIISGMGELHLDIIVDRMRREFNVDCTVGKPQVAYRETIRKSVESEGKFIRQTGGHGQYGHCWLRLEPMEPGKGFEFANEVVGGVIPKEFINPIQTGVEAALEDGVVAGYPMVDIKVTVYDGSYHDVDSSEMAFKVAGSMAFKDGAKKADPVLLEPYMAVEVDVPEEYMGDVIGGLNSRRGRIDGMETENGESRIKGFVPLSEMFGYATGLRSSTQGRGTFTMTFDHYEEVPKAISQQITEERLGKK